MEQEGRGDDRHRHDGQREDGAHDLGVGVPEARHAHDVPLGAHHGISGVVAHVEAVDGPERHRVQGQKLALHDVGRHAEGDGVADGVEEGVVVLVSRRGGHNLALAAHDERLHVRARTALVKHLHHLVEVDGREQRACHGAPPVTQRHDHGVVERGAVGARHEAVGDVALAGGVHALHVRATGQAGGPRRVPHVDAGVHVAEQEEPEMLVHLVDQVDLRHDIHVRIVERLALRKRLEQLERLVDAPFHAGKCRRDRHVRLVPHVGDCHERAEHEHHQDGDDGQHDAVERHLLVREPGGPLPVARFACHYVQLLRL